jgi:hypothetical protein
MFATTFIPRGTPILIKAQLVKVAIPEMVQGQDFRIET